MPRSIACLTITFCFNSKEVLYLFLIKSGTFKFLTEPLSYCNSVRMSSFHKFNFFKSLIKCLLITKYSPERTLRTYILDAYGSMLSLLFKICAVEAVGITVVNKLL